MARTAAAVIQAIASPCHSQVTMRVIARRLLLRRGVAGIRRRVFDQLAHAAELVGIRSLVAEQVEHQQTRRVVEEPVQDLRQRAVARLALIDDRQVRKRTPVLLVRDITLPLENAECREDGVIRGCMRAGETLDHVPDGCALAFPEHPHDA